MADQWIFLSHSGIQKPFTENLYSQLRRRGHNPFFDRDHVDSLPIGTEFPPRILEAATQCKLGVVVLSHEYIESKWPMLELEQLFQSKAEIYPLFYKLRPEDLTRNGNLRRWQTKWEAMASSSSAPSTRIWPELLRKLSQRSGEVFEPRTSELAYIDTIVSNICKKLPPRPPILLNKGMERLTQEIAAHFMESSQDAQVIVLGLYGVGGSGKSSLCKSVANFYKATHTGRSCCLELPSINGAEDNIVKFLKNALRTLIQTHDEGLQLITDVEEAIGLLNEQVHEHPVFLAVDNVTDHTFEIADKLISHVQFGCGSKLLVTSRSKQLLKRLLPPCSIESIPSISESEAMEVLVACCGRNLPVMQLSLQETLNDVVHQCFFGRQCHPLLLKAMGHKLREVADCMSNKNAWKNYISKLLRRPRHADDHLEKQVVSIFRKSLQDVSPELQSTFLDLVCTGLLKASTTTTKLCKRLCLLYEGCTEDDMRIQLQRLEYYGFVEREDENIGVHDLYRDAAEAEALAKGKYLLEASSIVEMDLRRLECIRMGRMKQNWQAEKEEILLSNLKHCSQVKFLQLYHGFSRNITLEPGMASLRILEIYYATHLEEVKGWNQVPNLVSVKLCGCLKLRRIGDMECSSKLQKLFISLADIDLSGVSRCFELKKVELRDNDQLENLCVESLQKLQKLVIVNCPNLEGTLDLTKSTELKKVELRDNNQLENLCVKSLQKLQKLLIVNCPNLEGTLDLTKSTGLKTLILSECQGLEGIEGVNVLVSLETLHLRSCNNLKGIPDLKNLVKLHSLRISHCWAKDDYLTKFLGVPTLEAVLEMEVCTRLQSIPDLKSLVYMHTLSLYDCPDLTEIEGVTALVSLEEFKVKKCSSLKRIPDLANLTKLNTLRIHSCKALKEIEGGIALVSLEVLDLKFCSRLKCIPGLVNMSKLITLRIHSCNALKEIGGGIALVSLEVLDVRFCSRLKRIPGLVNMSKLITLRIHSCDALKEIEGGIALVSLEVLNVRFCSRLKRIPGLVNMSKLITLRIHSCNALQELEGGTSLASLDFCDCSRLKRISGLVNMSKLVTLRIHSCNAFQELEGGTTLASLQVLDIADFTGLKRIPGLVNMSKLITLTIHSCTALQELEGGTTLVSLEVLDIWFCPRLKRIPGLVNMPKLITLRIRACDALQELEGGTSLASLEVRYCSGLKHISGLVNMSKLVTLRIDSCNALQELEGGTILANLQVLDIKFCSGLKRISGLVNMSKLITLTIHSCNALQELEGGTRLASLEVRDCSGLKRISGLVNMSKLVTLRIHSCNALQELEGGIILANLQVLDIKFCSGLKRISGLVNMSKLITLRIHSCNALQELEGGTSLASLEVRHCSGLKRISGLVNMSMLVTLRIHSCNALQELEGGTILASLQVLDIKFCSGLKRISGLVNMSKLITLTIHSCDALQELEGGTTLASLEVLDITFCSRFVWLT